MAFDRSTFVSARGRVDGVHRHGRRYIPAGAEHVYTRNWNVRAIGIRCGGGPLESIGLTPASPRKYRLDPVLLLFRHVAQRDDVRDQLRDLFFGQRVLPGRHYRGAACSAIRDRVEDELRSEIRPPLQGCCLSAGCLVPVAVEAGAVEPLLAGRDDVRVAQIRVREVGTCDACRGEMKNPDTCSQRQKAPPNNVPRPEGRPGRGTKLPQCSCSYHPIPM